MAGLLPFCAMARGLSAQSEVCPTGRIASIRIDRGPVFDEDVENGMLSKVYSAANWLHVETRRSVVERELLFEKGDCLERLRLSESERFLRDLPFIESARIEAHRRRNGDYDVEVKTRDDWSLRLEPRFEVGGGFALTGITLAERNLWGRGRNLELLYLDRKGRDDVGVTYFDPQFLSSRWNLSVQGIRTAPGWTTSFSLAYPFLGLVGRWAGFTDLLYGDRWFRFSVGDPNDPAELVLPLREKEAQVGTAVRLLGPPRGRSTKAGTYGASLSYVFRDYGLGFYSDTAAAAALGLSDSLAAELGTLVDRRETLRLNLIVGVRGLEYHERVGLTSLRSVEDIAIGATANLLFGVALDSFGFEDGHLLMALDLFGGARVIGGWFSQIRAVGEARRDYSARSWRDMLLAVEWTNFWQNNRRNVVELSTSYSAGWEMTVPFQLTLGGPWGLSAFSPNRFPGGARFRARIEDRYWAASVGRLADLGTVAFAELGRIWANDALSGIDSGLRASAGLGIRFATPAGSRASYRLQAAMPIEAGVRWDDMIVSFRIDTAVRLEERPVDVQLGRSRDLAFRAAAPHVR
ncbi:MAG: hypothetical protein GWN99_06575 [Gemmatimonadetes bacterium]|uniref:Uncharacterized protein n=1 Tax=Candidatus Kutchimonas denitrificans TaxID=3056748 RepID=A0AAE4Z6L5_9BACT|nr:hypothetical protein [Gemmatimonadota bacterium]NIR73677.1 hypothetical protein [Candidatus Kutchimonas denitrificans]NIS00727.1 hypothetical protein [Gemmatimonadota bacterium]NIT66314.1 hypothetical protein [Gemmatimonadota bacterium]NIU51532.1 hypothetical protein [Gemmatimonadota bacterium]